MVSSHRELDALIALTDLLFAGLNIDLKPCLDEVFGILGNSATALSSRLLVLAQLIQHNSKWSYGNTKCALPRTEVMLRFAAEEAVRYFFVAYFQVCSQ